MGGETLGVRREWWGGGWWGGRRWGGGRWGGWVVVLEACVGNQVGGLWGVGVHGL